MIWLVIVYVFGGWFVIAFIGGALYSYLMIRHTVSGAIAYARFRHQG